MTEKDIRLLNDYINGGSVDTNEIKKIEKKLDLIVKQMDVREEFNKKMEEIGKEMDSIK